MPSSTCDACAFFSSIEKECRIRAPTVVAVSVRQDTPGATPMLYAQTKWPTVAADAWCGEWKKK